MRGLVAGFVVLALSIYAPFTTVEASDVAITSLPAYYEFTKTVTITNSGKGTALGVVADVVLLPATTNYAHVTLSGTSLTPSTTKRDRYGNLIGVYDWSRLKPGQSVTLSLTYQATSSDVSYHLPRTYGAYHVSSESYKTYTNPKLEASYVDTDSATIKSLDASITRGMTNPYQKAQATFNWIVHNIHYNYSLHASGSALATLSSHLGICSDFAELYVGMLRTEGIPARLIGGYVTNNGGGQGGFHQWVEFQLPGTGWVVADPTWGQFGYFASLQDNWHIPLYDGIRSDISVHWQYTKSGTNLPHLAIKYHYHFSAQQGAPDHKHKKLPLVSVTPPVAIHHAALGFWTAIEVELIHGVHVAEREAFSVAQHLEKTLHV